MACAHANTNRPHPAHGGRGAQCEDAGTTDAPHTASNTPDAQVPNSSSRTAWSSRSKQVNQITGGRVHIGAEVITDLASRVRRARRRGWSIRRSGPLTRPEG
ncbi:hypothetical protein [Alloactinosynnema sp. L-07]|nr:hypothetical protein [Alloactinosynnema sp. L-07]